MRLLLHVCCAPCTIYPLKVLRERDYDVAGLFFNPNIHPYAEYVKRLDTVRDYAARKDMELTVLEGYPVELFFRSVSFHENERCTSCYRIRLEETARRAVEGKFEAFSSTLLYSRYQKHDLIRQMAEEISCKFRIGFIYIDFRQGWQEGIDVSKSLNMYRQKYCGCIYSERERFYRKGPGP